MSNNSMAMTDSTFDDKSQWSLVPSDTPNIATEDHLQSLGFEVNDGLPKFKLNEPGPAALASSIFQQNNMIVDDDSEQSFVVLGKTSFESIREASMASYMEIKEKSTLTDHNSLISMMSPSEIGDNLKKVLEENIKLKSTLKENNTAIKEQFNTITKWQKEVMAVCDNHKQKFQETKGLISSLKNENDELKRKIAEKCLLEWTQYVEQNPTPDQSLSTSCKSLSDKDISTNKNNIVPEVSNQKSAMYQGCQMTQSVGGNTSTCSSDESLSTSRKSLYYKDISTNKYNIIPEISNQKSAIYQGCQMTQSVGGNTSTYSSDDSLSTSCKPSYKDISPDIYTYGLGFRNEKSAVYQGRKSYLESTKSNEKDTRKSNYVWELNDTTVSSDFNSLENACSVNINRLLKEGREVEDKRNQLSNQQDLLKQISLLCSELSKVRLNYSTSQEVLQELEKRYQTDIEMFSQQLQKANKELESFKQHSSSTNSFELQKLVSNCCEKDMRLKYLEEIISSLELQVKKFNEKGLPLVDFEIESSHETSEDKKQLKEQIECYNAKLADINKCFASQCVQFLRMQECLRESACIIQVFETAQFLPNDLITEEKLKDYKEKLNIYRRTLVAQQLQSIDDKQATIKAQQQLQKIFADYNSIICELEILKDENSKLQTLQVKTQEENSQKWTEMEKQLNEDKLHVEREMSALVEATLSIQMDRKHIFEEKKQIETDRQNLMSEKEKLKHDIMSLSEEKTSLDRQSKLYEAEEGSLHKEKKALQKKCEYLYCEIEKLKHELNEAEITIKQLRAKNRELVESEELVTVYKIQTEVREKEFEDMRNLHKNLQNQFQYLTTVNLQLRAENDRLGGQERQENNFGESSDKQFVHVLICPKCTNGFDAGSITAHLQQCMNTH